MKSKSKSKMVVSWRQWTVVFLALDISHCNNLANKRLHTKVLRSPSKPTTATIAPAILFPLKIQLLPLFKSISLYQNRKANTHNIKIILYCMVLSRSQSRSSRRAAAHQNRGH